MHRQILPTLRIAALALGFLATDLALAGPQQELNKSLARRVYDEGLNQGIFTVPYTPDFIGHAGNSTFTRENSLAEAKGWRQAFPDLRMHIDLILAENDLVAIRWTATGTNTGTGNGIPATGKPVKATGQATFRFVDGKIAEEWATGDTIGIMRQLGLAARLDPDGFVRVSRSCIVNARHIRELQPQFSGDVVLVLADDSEVQGSRRYRDGIEALFG